MSENQDNDTPAEFIGEQDIADYADRAADLEAPLRPLSNETEKLTKPVLLVHRRGMNVVSSPENQNRNDKLEIQFLAGRASMMLTRLVRVAQETERAFQGFRIVLTDKDGNCLHSFEFDDDTLEVKTGADT